MRSSWISARVRLSGLLIFLACVAQPPASAAQGAHGKPTTAANAVAGLAPSSFKTKGLNYERELMALYMGDFAHARLKPDGASFGALFGKYLHDYATECKADLPKNKVEMTTQECSTWNVTYNGYGAEINRVCVAYRDVGTGLYADPDLYSAYNRVEANLGINMTRDTFQGMLHGGTGLGQTLHAVDAQNNVGDDMRQLLSMNGCASPGLHRFQSNLLRFALGQQPLLLPGGETVASIYPQGATEAAYRNADYAKLIDDLIVENAKAWMMNRYVQGSVRNMGVSFTKPKGLPALATANYLYEGINGRARGSVRLVFDDDGLPQCMYFSDIPDACRAPGRGILARFQNGGYSMGKDEASRVSANTTQATPGAAAPHPLLRPGTTVPANTVLRDVPSMPWYHEQISKLDSQVLVCSYASPEGQASETTYYFWKDHAPPNAGVLMALQSRKLAMMKDHAVSACPPDDQQASALSVSPAKATLTSGSAQEPVEPSAPPSAPSPSAQPQASVDEAALQAQRASAMQQQIQQRQQQRDARIAQQNAVRAKVQACAAALHSTHFANGIARSLAMEAYRTCLQDARRQP